MSEWGDRLRLVHEELWDPDAHLERLAPGAAPGIDLAPYNLHAVRESALGAFLDLRDGHVDRARSTIEALLAHQYPTNDQPWSGTFKVTAEQPDPPATGAREWVDYDPNWRQFLGVVLAMTLIAFEEELDASLSGAMTAAIGRCVTGEPVDRLPPWYTNPTVLHAWLTSWYGRRVGDPAWVAHGARRARTVVARFETYGDFDEYNSPTYDGVDLWALALWVAAPPDETFAREGRRLLDAVAGRMSTLYHPGLRVFCGPYLRSYGLLPERYVSLSALWFGVTGASADLVPRGLTPRSDHVHDLYFTPLFEYLAERVAVPLRALPVTSSRRHTQCFGAVTATSLLTPSACVGFESGRRHTFARDQYVPLSVHVADREGRTQCVGVSLGEDVATVTGSVATDGAVTVAVETRGDHPVVRLAASTPIQRGAGELVVGALRVFLDGGDVVERDAASDWYRVDVHQPSTLSFLLDPR